MLTQVAVGFAVASTLARLIGISRWLTAMPLLAARRQATTDDSVRAAIDVQYDLLNSFGGEVGELLGVSLFAALWLACTVAAARGRGVVGGWVVALGAGTAVAMALPLVELAGTAAGPLVAVGTAALSGWLLLAAVVLSRQQQS